MLTFVPTIVELYMIFLSMESSKSLCLDGTSPFSSRNIGVLWGKVHFAVIDFFNNSKINVTANHTFITLIPKQTVANRVDQFRLIALCNVAYKIITKILSTRLKPQLDDIIHPNQACSFQIPNRSIVNNEIINHKVMFYLNSKKGKNCYMAVKVDMTKVYDKVEWNILVELLHTHGFDDKLCNMIK